MRAPLTGGPPSARVTSTRSGVSAPVVGAVAMVGDGVWAEVEQAMTRTATSPRPMDR